MFLAGHGGDAATRRVPGTVIIAATWHELPPKCGCSTSTTAADSAAKALKRASELNGDDNERLSRELGAVVARTTRPKSVRQSG
jgi:hypothetical protein